MSEYHDVQRLLDAVRRRWRTKVALRAGTHAALAALVAIGIALVAARWISASPKLLAAIAALSFLAALAAVVWFLLPLRRRPTDAQIARFIEERAPGLDDRLATAVDVAKQPAPPAIADLMLADAATRARDVDVDAIVPTESLRRASFQAAAATLALVALVVFGREPLREAIDATALTLFPARVRLDVAPGNARVKVGTPLAISARLNGNRAPVIPQLQIADGDDWRAINMSVQPNGTFTQTFGAVTGPLRYRVAAGTVLSPSYDITVVRPPRVARIDVDYTYPEGLGIAPRSERDSGDIYAPAGTDVRVHVFTDRPAATGQLALGDGKELALNAAQPTEFTADLKVVSDTSYRIALADREGMKADPDTEYFIRMLDDRPPEVRVTRPAQDRQVTRLEEVDIDAEAEDDYAIDRLDLVYSVKGVEKTVPLAIPKKSATVKAHHTLFLEDLDVQPGDFVAYYVRARDLTRGTRPNEARSDMFFLEVKPFEQEFTLAASQAMAGAGGRSSIDDLVTAQKDVIISTFKLDRRAQAAKGAKSESDIRAVSRAESDLKERVEQTSGTFRESTMRDPRRGRGAGRGGQPPAPVPGTPRPGETLPEEDAMTQAAVAMGKAVMSLDDLKTSPALQPEMEALNHLLKAQADVKKREVQRQQAGSGAGSNRSNYDISTLFDKELKKQQQTNYETKSTSERREDPTQGALDKIKELASRQDELLKKQQELAKNRDKMSEEELKRELEKLTREQSELRQKAEELARQMPQNGQQSSADSQQSQSQSKSQQSPSNSQQSQSGQGGQSGSQQGMRDVSEAMRNAANDLRRQDAKQAAASGSRALDRLRQLQRQLESGNAPDEKRRALGDMQLEARQLADAQRQIASALNKTPQGEAGKDSVRRLAGEEERLAERARGLQQRLKQEGAGQAATTDAAKELDRQRLADRMQRSADAMRTATGEQPNGRGRQAGEEAKSQAAAQQDLARALDNVADKLASASGAGDAESRKLSDQLARAQQLKGEIDRLSKQMADAGRAGQRAEGRGQDGRPSQSQSSSQQSQPNGQPSQSQSQSAGQSESKSAGQQGRAGEGQGGGGGNGSDATRLRDEYARKLQETRELMDQLKRDDPTNARGGAGFTYEGQGMVLSAPGTEAFKQDFARWEELRKQATQALDNAETTLTKKLQAKQAKDRLAAGADDKAPATYQEQVDDYFKAIAKKKQ
jgi:hypothetical protein